MIESLQILLQDPVTFVMVIAMTFCATLCVGWLVREAIFIFQYRRSRIDRTVPRQGHPIPARERVLLGECWYDRVADFRKRD
mgnify:CR=1 FL=1